MRKFTYLNNQWTIELSGSSRGVSSGRPPAIMTIGVIFNCISDSTQGPYYGSIRRENIDDETDDNLRKYLEEAIAKSTHQTEQSMHK